MGFGVFEKISKLHLRDESLINIGTLFVYVSVYFNERKVNLIDMRYFCDLAGNYQETTMKQFQTKMKKEIQHALLVLTFYSNLIENN